MTSLFAEELIGGEKGKIFLSSAHKTSWLASDKSLSSRNGEEHFQLETFQDFSVIFAPSRRANENPLACFCRDGGALRASLAHAVSTVNLENCRW